MACLARPLLFSISTKGERNGSDEAEQSSKDVDHHAQFA